VLLLDVDRCYHHLRLTIPQYRISVAGCLLPPLEYRRSKETRGGGTMVMRCRSWCERSAPENSWAIGGISLEKSILPAEITPHI
jgi:hypothetical protein